MKRQFASCQRQSERGVILILTLFVLLITYALVAQITIGTSVAYQVTTNQADGQRMRGAGVSAGNEILNSLADDMPGGGAAEGMADSLGEGFDPGGLGDSSGPGSGEEGEEGEEEDDGSNSDSINDAWARMQRYNYGDIEVHTFVQDENGKFNLTLLFVADEDTQAENRERFIRILDRLRDGFDDDLDPLEAGRILDEIVDWVEGNTRTLDLPARVGHSVQVASEVAASEEESASVANTGLYLPGRLEELMVLERVDENLFYDQLRYEDKIAMGLESVLTVYTTVGLDPPSAEEVGDEPSDASGPGAIPDPAAETEDNSQEESQSEDSSSLGQAPGGLDDLLDAEPGLGHLININTSPRPVLEGLLPESELPVWFIEELLRRRNEIDEEALQEQEGEDVDTEDMEYQRAVFREDEQVPLLYFRNLEDLAEIDGYEDRLEDEVKEKLNTLIGVQSDVFSIYLWCRIPPEDWEQERHYEEAPGNILRLKAVVWRRGGSDGAKFLFLEPWHEVPATRWQIPDFQDELPVFLAPEY